MFRSYLSIISLPNQLSSVTTASILSPRESERLLNPPNYSAQGIQNLAYGGHIEFIRFKEYYGMRKGHEHDPIYSLSINTRFSGQFFFKFSKKIKIVMEKKDRCSLFGCNNDCLFPVKYTVKFSVFGSEKRP